MSNDKQFIGGVEPMIDAKQAAAALRLPYYWFADPQMRSKYKIPHYLMGGLVRYRPSELSAWAARSRSWERCRARPLPMLWATKVSRRWSSTLNRIAGS